MSIEDLSRLNQDLQYHAGPHAVLMLHGLGASPLELARLAQEAREEGLSVYAPLIQGYGYGSCPQTWGHWRDQVLRHFRDCQARYETVSVLGVSMGATLALMLAEFESPTSVVALAPALAYDGWAIPWVHSLVGLARWIPFSGRYQYVEREPYGLKNTETRAMIKRLLKSQHVSEVGSETLALELILQGRQLIAQVMSEPERIHSPILFMHAVDDESVHVRNPERIYGQVSSKEKEFIYLGDSYHMITIDNERDLVRKESLRFIKTAVNRCTRQPAFEMPHSQSYELRRQLQAQ
jgi:carboxylesterase